MANDDGRRALPPELAGLDELALDLRWAGSCLAARVWEKLDPEAWERTRNPWIILQYVPEERLLRAAKDRELVARLRRWMDWRQGIMGKPGWFATEHKGSGLSTIAYFSMEFGLSEALPIYSGGLGILAGDHLKSASDLDVPVTGIGLLYQQGYFRQVLAPDGGQLEAFPYNAPGSMPVTPVTVDDGHRLRVRLPLPGRTLLLRVWEAKVGRTRLVLLDSNDPLNSPWDRGITANLYAAGREKRLLQEIVLGVGGWQLIEKLGLPVEVCHLNEGHAAFAVLARAASFARRHEVDFDVALRATRAGNVFTTHTPVEAAFDRFSPELLAAFVQPVLDEMGITLDRVLAMGRKNHPNDPAEPLNMAYLAMRGAGRVNGVSRLHGAVSRRLFAELYPRRPLAEMPVNHITNGVHLPTWDSAAVTELLGAASGEGRQSGNLETALSTLADVSDARLWDFRAKARLALVTYVRRRLVRQLEYRAASPEQLSRAQRVLDPDALTLGFARRFTPYKRPTLLLRDPERLARILRSTARPVQLIVAGKAHPNDGFGKEMVREVARYAARDDLRDRAVFLEDYDMVLSQQLLGGVDVWLNTPRRPNEACGTSGMKTLVNGGLNLSILDGWWDEAYDPEVGFQIGDGIEAPGGERDAAVAEELYGLLERELIPEFFDRDAEGIPRRWIAKVRRSMMRLTPRFSSDRMVRDYVTEAYLPAARAYVARAAGDLGLAKELERWRQQVRLNWSGLRFDSLNVTRDGDRWHFDLLAYLGDLDPDSVRVELYAEPAGDGGPVVIPLERTGPVPGANNGHSYAGAAPGDRPADHYTPRIVPYHPMAILPLEASEVFWG